MSHKENVIMHWHPMLVHFPITLVFVWPFVDIVGLALKNRTLNVLAIVLLSLAVVTSLIAGSTGEIDAHAALDMGYSASVLKQHTFLADIFPWIMFGVLVVRLLGGFWWPKRGGALLGVILGILCCPLVAYIGYTGGQLVYEHGVGVETHNPTEAKEVKEQPAH